jgi:hypothetical protein
MGWPIASSLYGLPERSVRTVLSPRRRAGGRGHGECHGDLDTANEEGRRRHGAQRTQDVRQRGHGDAAVVAAAGREFQRMQRLTDPMLMWNVETIYLQAATGVNDSPKSRDL